MALLLVLPWSSRPGTSGNGPGSGASGAGRGLGFGVAVGNGCGVFAAALGLAVGDGVATGEGVGADAGGGVVAGGVSGVGSGVGVSAGVGLALLASGVGVGLDWGAVVAIALACGLLVGALVLGSSKLPGTVPVWVWSSLPHPLMVNTATSSRAGFSAKKPACLFTRCSPPISGLCNPRGGQATVRCYAPSV